jgi:hypothetical protein
MRVSKFVKPNKDILIEYIYDDGNNIGEAYKVLQNIRDNSLSYISASASITNNTPNNQLIQLDPVTNNYGLLNTDTYGFLQLKDFSSGFPVRHDIIKVHLPINYTFGEYLGFYMRVYTFDYLNRNQHTLSSFYFDNSNIEQNYLYSFNTPAFLFQEKLWGKNISVLVPSVYSVSRLRVGTGTKTNSINSNLTNGLGLSITSPVFIDFHFITQKRTVNSIVTYNLTPKISMSVPQAPDFENIGVKIQPSPFGDYFEIFGVFNGDINQFDNFIQNAFVNGNRYYVNFTITLFEQNIRGKTFTITLTDNFNEKIEFRPIIKFSTTTAIIDVEMNLVDAVDNSSIYRKASYGLLQDEVAKYSLNLTKINIANASKPKIYNIKSPEGAGIFGNGNTRNGNNRQGVFDNVQSPQVRVETVKINYAVLTNMFSVVAKSENVVVGKDVFYGIGKMEILLQPFDNVIKFRVAQDVTQVTLSSTLRSPNQFSANAVYMDMTNMGEIKLVIKNEKILFEAPLFVASNEIDLANGVVVFKIPQDRMADIKKVEASNQNIFYITSNTEAGTVNIFSGLYTVIDNAKNINMIKEQVRTAQQEASNLSQAGSSIIPDPDLQSGAAIVSVTPVVVNTTSFITNNTTNTTSNSTSVESSTKIKKIVYRIDSKSNLIINGYSWTNTQIKTVLGLNDVPINLTFKSDALYSSNKFLDKLSDLEAKLISNFITTPEKREALQRTKEEFTNNQNQ